MKVLYDYEIFVIQKYGGASRYFYEIISRLTEKEKLEIILYMGEHINKYELEKFSNRFLIFKGNRVRHIPKSKMLSVFLQKPFFESFRKKTDYDIFHKTFFTRYRREKKGKMITTIHDFTPEKYPGSFSRFNNTIEAKKRIIKEADGIICISETTKKDMLSLYNVPEEKIKVIYHGNSLNINSEVKPIINQPYLLYVGDRRTYKNFIILLETYRNSSLINNNFKLLCFGGGKFSNKENEFLARNSLTGKVIQTEGSDEMLASAYKYASVFIYPSIYEGFGIPLLEAMHLGCPIIASDSSCFPEIAGKAALFFNPASIDDLTAKIEFVAGNSETRNRLIETGYEREKLFSWDKCAEECYNFYNYIHLS